MEFNNNTPVLFISLISQDILLTNYELSKNNSFSIIIELAFDKFMKEWKYVKNYVLRFKLYHSDFKSTC